MRESQIESKLGRMIRKGGGQFYKFVSPGNPGVPDRLVALPGGRVVFVELKTETGKLSAIQRWRIDEMRALGLDVRLLRGWEEARVFAEEVVPE